MPTEFVRKDAEMIGGNINNLISNQYEKDYLMRAQEIDAMYQEHNSMSKRRKMAMLSTNGTYYDT